MDKTLRMDDERAGMDCGTFAGFEGGIPDGKTVGDGGGRLRFFWGVL